jgi:O-antigen/teichoic acid export membrane protein
VIVPLQLLCVVSCIRAIETMNSPLLLAMGRPQIAVRNNLLQVLVMPPAFYLGAQFGLVGVAIAWVITWPILSGIVTYQTLELIGLPVSAYAKALVHPVVSSVVMVAVVVAVQRSLLAAAPAVVVLVVSGVLGCGLYFGYHWVFNRAAVSEALDTIRPRRGRAREASAATDAAIA